MIRHVAMFRWNADVSEQQIAAAATMLNGLPEVIDSLVAYHHGRDLQLIDGNYHYAVVADFHDAAGFHAYRDHPAHVAFAQSFVAPYVAERVAVQFEL